MELILIAYFLGVILGLVGLWWSSDKTVERAIQLSQIFGITTFFIGFVLMAIATGLPELAIAITSLWNGVPLVAAGAIIGSNLIDISLVLGVPAVFLGTLNVKKEDKRPLMFMLVVTALVMAFVFVVGVLTPVYGLFLVVLYFVIILWLWKTKATQVIREEVAVEELSSEEIVRRKKLWSTRFWIAGKLLLNLFFVMLFSKISIDCAVVLAKHFSMTLTTVGATIFAIGTSLPELALSVQAVRRKEYSLAFGNSFGSVLEQATLILGLLALGARRPLNITALRSIAPLMFLSYAIVAHSLLKKTKVGRQEGLSRYEGIALLALFLIHIFYFLVWKG